MSLNLSLYQQFRNRKASQIFYSNNRLLTLNHQMLSTLPSFYQFRIQQFILLFEILLDDDYIF